jgi:5-methyltetrahydrofolate--homocysteine methyltransferase
MADLIAQLREATSLPLIAQANAGKATLSAEGEVAYSQGIDDYITNIPLIIQKGAHLVGGCCGTDPEYIRRMADIIF